MVDKLERVDNVEVRSKTTVRFNGITFNIKSTPDVYYPTGKSGKDCEFVIIFRDECYFKKHKKE